MHFKNCCVEAIYAVNAVLWQPGELTQNHGQTDKQTDRPTDYYNPWPPNIYVR